MAGHFSHPTTVLTRCKTRSGRFKRFGIRPAYERSPCLRAGQRGWIKMILEKSVPTRLRVLAFVCALATLPSARAGEFFVSPQGRTNGTGAANNPWDLQTALYHPAAVSPGDTIWLRGGTYRAPW